MRLQLPVRLEAFRALITLKVPSLRMRFHVIIEQGLRGIAIPAFVTFVGFDIQMAPLVNIQGGFLNERFPANVALMRLLSTMCLHVDVVGAVVSEAFPADIAYYSHQPLVNGQFVFLKTFLVAE